MRTRGSESGTITGNPKIAGMVGAMMDPTETVIQEIGASGTVSDCRMLSFGLDETLRMTNKQSHFFP